MSNTDHQSDYMVRLWRTVAVVALAAIGVWMVSVLVKGLLILFAGLLLAVFLNRLSRNIQRPSGLAYAASLVLVVLSIMALSAAIAYFMGSRISAQLSEFAEQFSTAIEQAWKRVEELGWRRRVDGRATGEVQDLLPSNVSMMSTARSGLMALVNVVGGVVVIMFVGLYLAVAPSTYRQGLVRLFPPKRRPRIDDVLLKVGNALWAWTLGRLIAMALIAVGSTAGLWMIGIPLPATLGVLAGVSNFVPNLGPLIASVPPLLFGLQQGGNSALYVAGFYLALQVVESYLITPLIDQQQVRLPPALTLAGQLLLGMIAGFMGLLLATPLIAAAHVVIRELYVKDVLEANA